MFYFISNEVFFAVKSQKMETRVRQADERVSLNLRVCRLGIHNCHRLIALLCIIVIFFYFLYIRFFLIIFLNFFFYRFNFKILIDVFLCIFIVFLLFFHYWVLSDIIENLKKLNEISMYLLLILQYDFKFYFTLVCLCV